MTMMYDQEVQAAKYAMIDRFKEAGIEELLWPVYARVIAEEMAVYIVEQHCVKLRKAMEEQEAIKEFNREV